MIIDDIKKILECVGYNVNFENDCITTLSITKNRHDVCYKVFKDGDKLCLLVKTFRRFNIDENQNDLYRILCELTDRYAYFQFRLSDTNEIIMQYAINVHFDVNLCIIGEMMNTAGQIIDCMADDNIGKYSGI